MKINVLLISVIITVSFVGAAFAESNVYIFAKEGQSAKQQREDEGYCEAWTQEQTGVSPDYVHGELNVIGSVEGSAQKTGSAGGALIKGAAAGAIFGGMGNIDDEWGRGAARGAFASTLRRREKNKEAQQQQAVEAHNNRVYGLQKKLEEHKRAFSACMDARGYSVK